MSNAAAERKLAQYLAEYTPEIAALGENALATLRQLLPGAVEMVYDSHNITR